MPVVPHWVEVVLFTIFHRPTHLPLHMILDGPPTHPFTWGGVLPHLCMILDGHAHQASNTKIERPTHPTSQTIFDGPTHLFIRYMMVHPLSPSHEKGIFHSPKLSHDIRWACQLMSFTLYVRGNNVTYDSIGKSLIFINFARKLT